MSELSRKQVMKMTTDIARWTGHHSQPIAQYLNALDRHDVALRETIRQQAERINQVEENRDQIATQLNETCIELGKLEAELARIKAVKRDWHEVEGG